MIARRRPGAAVAESVAPASADLGVMLPYSPLHHLLLADLGATLVMTSANVSDEPIAYEDADARERLDGIADLFLTHDRPIHMRTDDSVVRSTARGPLLMRRSRGYVPASIALPVEAPPLLACGAELKSTFCVAKGGTAWVGHHIGDLRNWETLRSFREGIEHFERLFAVAPEVVAHDLHPDYLSTALRARARGRAPRGRAAPPRPPGRLPGRARRDRARPWGRSTTARGYGGDGTVWGGELLVGDLSGFERAGMLLPVRLPGGDRAADGALADGVRVARGRAGRRAAAARAAWRWTPTAGGRWPSWRATGIASPLTTSVGRLFDAVAALCGLRPQVTYEGQAAAELESAARPRRARRLRDAARWAPIRWCSTRAPPCSRRSRDAARARRS